MVAKALEDLTELRSEISRIGPKISRENTRITQLAQQLREG